MQPDQAINTRGFSVSRPILGWGPSAPGTYHAARTGVDGRLIYNVDYTIDNQLLRRTQSGPGDPTVAFFGDSFTFGVRIRFAPQADLGSTKGSCLGGHSLRGLARSFPCPWQ